MMPAGQFMYETFQEIDPGPVLRWKFLSKNEQRKWARLEELYELRGEE